MPYNRYKRYLHDEECLKPRKSFLRDLKCVQMGISAPTSLMQMPYRDVIVSDQNFVLNLTYFFY